MSRLMNKLINRINVLIKHSYWYNCVQFSDCQKFWGQNNFNLDLVNLGSSSGKYAFNYDGYYKCANWAMAPKSLYGDLLILKNYCSYLKPSGSIVLISLCPFSSLGGQYSDLDYRYYTIINSNSISNYSFKKYQEAIDLKNNPFLYYPFASIVRDIKYSLKRKEDAIMSLEQMEDNAKSWMSNWAKEFSITDFESPLRLINKDRFHESAVALNNLICFCLSRNIKPILVIPPMHKTLTNKFSDSMKEKFIYAFIEEGNKECIPFLDYMEDDELSDITLFRNSYFLNEKGAKLFTRKVLKDVNFL